MSGERDELEKRLNVCSELRRRQKNLLLTIPPGAEYDAARLRMIELVRESEPLKLNGTAVGGRKARRVADGAWSSPETEAEDMSAELLSKIALGEQLLEERSRELRDLEAERGRLAEFFGSDDLVKNFQPDLVRKDRVQSG